MASKDGHWSFDPSDAGQRIEVLRQLGTHGGPQAQNQILSLRDDKDPFVRGTVYEALGTLGEGCALPLIEPGFFDPDLRTRMNAIEACRRCGLRAATNNIIRLLEDPDPLVRTQAALALGEWKAPGASATMERAIKSENDDTTLGHLYWALLRITSSDENWDDLAGTPWETRNATVRTMGYGGLHGGGKTLERWLISEESGFKWTVAKMLDGFADRPDDGFLLDLLVQAEPTMQAEIMERLAYRNYPELIELARGLKGDHCEALKLAGFRVLLGHGDPSDVPLIQRVTPTNAGSVRDLGRFVCTTLEGRAPVISKRRLSIQDANNLSKSTSKEDRLLGAGLRIESGISSAFEILQTLDKTWASRSQVLTDVVVAACLHREPGAQEIADKNFQSDPINTWEQFGKIIETSGFGWVGRPQGRFSQPLQDTGVTNARDLLCRVGYTRFGLLPILRNGKLDMVHRWLAVDKLRDRFVMLQME